MRNLLLILLCSTGLYTHANSESQLLKELETEMRIGFSTNNAWFEYDAAVIESKIRKSVSENRKEVLTTADCLDIEKLIPYTLNLKRFAELVAKAKSADNEILTPIQETMHSASMQLWTLRGDCEEMLEEADVAQSLAKRKELQISFYRVIRSVIDTTLGKL